MPQIWLNDDELGAMLGCPAAIARDRSIAGGWARRRGHDGISRSKLPEEMFEGFLLDYAARLIAARAADQSVMQLREMLTQAKYEMRPSHSARNEMAA